MMIEFTKMQGAGNDYIYVNTILYDIKNPKEMARRWSDRHKGIGSDGLVLIGAPRNASNDFSMRIFNADGSEAMMCGNASRCIGKYLYEKNLTRKTTILLETLSGVRTLLLTIDMEGHTVSSVSVDMSEPSGIRRDMTVRVRGAQLSGTFVSMGNPHFVVLVDRLDSINVAFFGELLEHADVFPDRANIEFVQIIGPDELRVRVWERGSGITMACGTGACAAAVAMALAGLTQRAVNVVMDGGTLRVDWKSDGHVYLSGDADFVFEGRIVS